MKNGISLVILSILSFIQINAQSLYRVSLDEKTAQSSLIVEGKVIDQSCYWNSAHTLIYTTNKIEIFKIFKGAVQSATVNVITEGGSVDGQAMQVSDLLSLSVNQVGMFFLNPARTDLQERSSAEKTWEVYSSAQGFIKYDLHNGTASAPFARYKNISREFYGELKARTGQNFENRKPSFSADSRQHQEAKIAAPVITSFSPTTVHAGATLDPVNNVLTINGSGFGTPSGTAAVLFDDADDGSGGTPYQVPYNSPLIISWTDTQIQLQVPTNAGTGALQVQDASGTLATAPTNLEVLYSILSVTYSISGTVYVRESNLMDFNGTGGYDVVYSTSTAGSGVDINASTAKQTFQRALTTWQEVAGFHVTEAGTTTNQAISNDGINTIMFDNTNTGSSPLPAGVLAVCYSFYGVCPSNPSVNQVQKTGFDIVIRNNAVSSGSTSFNTGPCPPNSVDFNLVDLESVILHELGHAISLGHVNDDLQGALIVGQVNPAKLMNWATTNSVRRISPDYSALAGALYAIQQQGNTYGTCGASAEMTPLSTISEAKDECPASFPLTPTPYNTSVNFDLVHATSNKYTDPAYNQVRCDGKGTAITNNAYYAFRTNPAGGILSLTVSGYSTTPAAIASCTQIYAGVPVSGVRLAIYQASSCPSAGSYPAPVACTTFNGNGTLPDITGLSANTNYLLYVDGIENTKASFSIRFGGSILPVKFQRFSGKVFTDYNQLDWQVETAAGFTEIVLEKSSDGVNYAALYSSFLHGDPSSSGGYNDYHPLSGKNFYRLAAIHQDGHREYSNVVLLERNNQEFSAAVFPNPAGTFIKVQIRTTKSGTYIFELYNNFGQLIKSQHRIVAGTSQEVQIPVANIAAGSYLVRIVDSQRQTIKNIPVIISGQQ
jgi:hypothetical protein